MLTDGNRRCARCSMVVLDVFNAMMQDLMQDQPITAPILYQMIMNDGRFQKDKLNSVEKHTIQTLQNEGFSKLDVSIIYKIAKYFPGLIPSPTRHWGSNPELYETNIGDDVERIRIERNRFVHKVRAEITDQEMTDFFVTSIEIGKRIDIKLHKTNDDGHEQKILQYLDCSMDLDTQEKYLKALQDIEFLKRTMTAMVGDRELHFYQGRSIAQVIATAKESLNDDDSMTQVKLIFHDVEDEENIIDQLNTLKLNTDNIKFIRATQQCIAVSVFIRNTVLVNSRSLQSEVELFVKKIVSSTGMMFSSEKYFSIVVVSSEDVDEDRQFLSDESEGKFDCKEPDTKKRRVDISKGDIKRSHTMILDLEIRNKVFHSTELVKENFERFLGNIVEETKGPIFSIQGDGPLNVVLAANDNDLRSSMRQKTQTKKWSKSSSKDIYFSRKTTRFGEVIDRNEMRLVVIGQTGTGKSATGNTILGKRLFKSILSCSSITNNCQLETCTRFDRKIKIVDTPGLYDTGMTNEQVKREIEKCIAMTAPGPHAILLAINIGKFTDQEYDTVKHLENLFGDAIYNYIVVVFTRADELEAHNLDMKEYIRNSPENLKEILELCHNRYIPFNNNLPDSCQELQVKDLIGSVDEIIYKNNGFCYTNEMFEEAKKLMQRREEAVELKLKEEEERKVKLLKDEFDIKMKLVEKKQAEQLLVQANKANDDRVAQLRKQMETERRLAQEMENMRREHVRELHAALSRPITFPGEDGRSSGCSLM